jgi:hypothetical protein
MKISCSLLFSLLPVITAIICSSETNKLDESICFEKTVTYVTDISCIVQEDPSNIRTWQMEISDRNTVCLKEYDGKSYQVAQYSKLIEEAETHFDDLEISELGKRSYVSSHDPNKEMPPRSRALTKFTDLEIKLNQSSENKCQDSSRAIVNYLNTLDSAESIHGEFIVKNYGAKGYLRTIDQYFQCLPSNSLKPGQKWVDGSTEHLRGQISICSDTMEFLGMEDELAKINVNSYIYSDTSHNVTHWKHLVAVEHYSGTRNGTMWVDPESNVLVKWEYSVEVTGKQVHRNSETGDIVARSPFSSTYQVLINQIDK